MITDEMLDAAARRLEEFVMQRALHIAEDIGFGWVAERGAPQDMTQLETEYKRCDKAFGRLPLPVWDGACENTIYSEPKYNHAFRFWHDTIHVKRSWQMTFADEIKVGQEQANSVARKFGRTSLEYKLMLADTCGQSLYHAMHDKFPDNQKEFVYNLVRNQS